MDLEVSTWTRRERLERIASAERDRRAGRGELALATLGEGGEWPARLVLALIRLADDEGAEARAILEGTLDDWAAEAGLDPLDAPQASAAVEAQDAAEALAAVETPDSPDEAGPPPAANMLASPIEIDELDRAFAEAEAQTDEMLDVNTVAARVLMEEPVGLTELDDDGPSEPMPGEPIATDAAWVVPSSAIEPAADADATPSASASRNDFDVAPDEVATASRPDRSDEMDAARVEDTPGAPSRGQVIETLERWLSNLERGRATRTAQQDRGA